MVISDDALTICFVFVFPTPFLYSKFEPSGRAALEDSGRAEPLAFLLQLRLATEKIQSMR